MTDELYQAACPFCGEVEYVGLFESVRVDPKYFIGCKNCGAQGPWSENMQEAYNRWNTREPEQST